MRTRVAVLAALEELLAAAPLESVSVQAVAERARVAVGTVYVHFESKRHLALALALDRAAPLIARAVTSAEPPGLSRALALGDLLAAAGTRSHAATHLLEQPEPVYRDVIAADQVAAPLAQHMLHLFARFDGDLDTESAVAAATALGVSPRALRAALLRVWLGLLRPWPYGVGVYPDADVVKTDEMWRALRAASRLGHAQVCR